VDKKICIAGRSKRTTTAPMIAKLYIQTALRNSITCLKENYFTPPFKVTNITEDKNSKKLHLMLMNSSPGILDKDEYEVKIDLGEGSSLQLHTQSYQRLFNMKTGATQLVEVYLQKGASFIYLPHPSVPHENSVFRAKNKILLQNDCRLIWGEILTCGRKLNGEVFLFSQYHNITEVFMNNKLVIKENLLIQPYIVDPNGMGQLEGYTHQASFIYMDEKADCNNAADMIHDYLSSKAEIVFGVTTAPVNGLIIRILGYKAEQLHNCLKEIQGMLSQEIKAKEPVVIYAN
jgi:urease accessory protein